MSMQLRSGRTVRSAFRTPGFTPGGIARYAAGQLVRNVVPGARYIHAGYTVGRSVANALRQYRSRQARQARRRGPAPGPATGVYTGKFKRAKRVTRRIETALTSYSSSGYVLHKEVFGSVSDPHCIYLGHTTFNINEIAEVVGKALLRKLFRKGGFNPDTPEQEIPGEDYNNSTGYRIEMITKTPAGVSTVFTYTLGNDQNINTIYNSWATLSNTLLSAMSGTATNKIERIALYTADDTGAGNLYRFKTELNMQREVVQIAVTSKMVIQNRTLGAAATTGDADRTDNQPLQGTRYQFVGGAPKTKGMGNAVMDSVNQNSLTTTPSPVQPIMTYRSQELPIPRLFQTPPPVKWFGNVTKSSKVKLQVGEIKTSYITSYWRGYVNNMLHGKFKVELAGTWQTFMPGKCELFALEEVLNSGSGNPILASYECNRYVMGKLVTTKAPIMLPDYQEYVQNNVS